MTKLANRAVDQAQDLGANTTTLKEIYGLVDGHKPAVDCFGG